MLAVTVRGYDDNGRGVPVAGATVRLGSATAVTDANGVAQVTAPAGGAARLTAEHDGHGAVVAEDGARPVRRLLAPARRSAPRSPAAASARATRRRAGGTELTVSRNFGAEELGHDKRKTIPGGETVMRQLQRKFDGRDALRRRLRAGDRRRLGRPAQRAARSTGSTTSTGSRPESGAAVAAARARRPRVVGPPRLGRGDADPGGGRLVPRAVPQRRAGQEDPDPDRLCRATRCASAARCASGSRPRGCKVGGSGTLGMRAGPGRAAAAGRPLVGGARRPDRAAAREGAEGLGRVRAADAPTASSSSCSTRTARPVRSLGAGSGLVAATRFLDQQPTWVVTGTDQVGVASAAAALVEERLKDHFAVALEQGREVPVPLPATASRGHRERDDAVSYRRRDEPAARGARGRRLACSASCSPAWRCRSSIRCCSRALLLAVLGAAVGARVGRRGRALAAVGAAVRAADRGGQRARRARRADGDRALRQAAAAGGDRRDARGDRVYGGILGLRALIVIACFALHSAAVDPDELLRAFRRLSFRSALTAALATRMVPVLARDARRFRDAQRCRPGQPGLAAGAGAGGDVGGARPRGRRRRHARGARLRRLRDARRGGGGRGRGTTSRSRRRRSCSPALGVAAAVGGWESFAAYPRWSRRSAAESSRSRRRCSPSPCCPFADRRGIGR